MIIIHEDGETELVEEKPIAPESVESAFDDLNTQLQEIGYETELHKDKSGAVSLRAVPPVKK